MEMILKVLIGFIALIHVLFLIVQMFLWDTEFVQKRIVGDFTPEQISAILAQNQGLYNGFLAGGLIWGLFVSQFPQVEPSSIVVFFLICVAIAGIFGSISLKRPTAFLIQSVPAILALFLLWYPHF
jgi:putative membrane protein